MAPEENQEGLIASGSTLPLVSIGIPVYNGAEHLAQAIQSVLGQDYFNLELVICDNASEDETETICRHYERADRRVRYFRQEVNIGFLPNFRRARDEAQGAYFGWLAHDDHLDPSYISTVVKYCESHPDVVACSTSFLLLNNERPGWSETLELTELHPGRWPASERALFRWPHGWLDTAIYGVFRREEILNVPLPERTYKGIPHILWWEQDVLTALSRVGRVVSLPQCLRSYRLAVDSAGTGVSDAFSTFDLIRIGLGVKRNLTARARRMPIGRLHRYRLVTTTLANFFRGNLRNPYDHKYLSRLRERALAELVRESRERSRVIDSLQQAVAERRELAIRLGFEVAELPGTSLPWAVPPTPDAPLHDVASRGLLQDFFSPPADWQIRRGQQVRQAMAAFYNLCDWQQTTIDRLHAEATRLLERIDSLSPSDGSHS